jgi:hypothetical protein
MSVFGMISLVYLALFAGSIGQSQTEQQTFDTPYKLRNMLFGWACHIDVAVTPFSYPLSSCFWMF